VRKTLIVTLALLVGCATGVAMRDLVVPARAQGSAGPVYEYQAVQVLNPTPEKVQEVLGRFGKEGWRYVGLAGAWDLGPILAFERPRTLP
jgi:hypothetical protein